MKRIATVLAVLVLLGSLVPTVGATGSAQRGAYSGTHVSFGTSASALTDYAVGGETMLSAVKVQSASEAESSGLVGVGASLSAVTSLSGAGLAVSAKTEADATVDVEGSASMDAHDNGNGVLVVRAGGESQYVKADLSDGAQATSTGDGRVTVTTADGVKGTFVVVGDGDVAVNEAGDVAAKLGGDGRLVFRAYPDGKSAADSAEERLIADGQAAGEVHVMAEEGGTVTDTVSYGSGTTIAAEQTADGAVDVTVDRAAHEGQVVITTVAESALDATGDLSVTVDGEAAAEASSYAELQRAIGSDRSKYLVRGGGDADGEARVLVAVNHFSERTIAMSEGDGDGSTASDGGSADGSGGSDSPISSPGQPGFGATVAIVAVIEAAALARRRR